MSYRDELEKKHAKATMEVLESEEGRAVEILCGLIELAQSSASGRGFDVVVQPGSGAPYLADRKSPDDHYLQGLSRDALLAIQEIIGAGQ